MTSSYAVAPATLKRRGFTLVELLVVIGIIALLISILLPALSVARRQAAAVKCSAALRELGNAYHMYAVENQGWWPVLKHDNYQVGTMLARGDAYWWDFVAKYIARGKKFGTASGTNAQDAADARNSVVWGCPAWEGYNTGTVGEMHRLMPGYGMNFEPRMTPSFPAVMGLTTSARDRARNGTAATGKFWKQTAWIRPSEKMLLADAKFYQVEQLRIAAPPMPGQDARLNFTYSTPAELGQNMYDIYRHGKPSGIQPGTTKFSTQGGKIAYNILYCDGHVATVTTQDEGYRAIRQRFPG